MVSIEKPMVSIEKPMVSKDPNGVSGARPDSLPRLAWPLLIGAFLGNAGIAAAESCGALWRGKGSARGPGRFEISVDLVETYSKYIDNMYKNIYRKYIENI